MMAGHNKWSKIRHKKGANDRKKATVLGKASKAITVASRDCKGDRSDFRLQTAVQHAKSVQLPRDRIEEAIEKGTGRSSGSDTSSGGGSGGGGGGGGGEKFETLRFDAMMRLEDNQSRSFGGEQDSSSSSSVQVACVVTALSDNRNRTTQHVRHLVTKFGGEFLPTDHLNYLFDHVGHVLVELDDNYNKDGDSNNNDDDNDDDDDDDNNDDLEALEEALMECALEAGATNIEPADEYEYDNDEDDLDLDIDEPCESGEISSATGISATRFVVTTDDKDLWKVVSALRGEHENGNDNGNGNDNSNDSGSPRRWKLLRFEHKYVPKEDFGEAASVIVHPDSPARERLEEFLDHLDDNEDVHKVYHNAVDPV